MTVNDVSIENEFDRWLEVMDGNEDREALNALASNPQLLKDAFARDLHFGTGGLRAKIGMGPNRLNVWTVGKATQGLANWLNSQVDEPLVVIARDSRHGGPEFVRRAAEVLAANGIRSVVFGHPSPTPVLSFAVRDLGCSAGIIVTASHNPAEYNGYKVYGPDGCQATTEMCRQIQAAIDSVDIFDDVCAEPFDAAIESGLTAWASGDVLDRYVSSTLSCSQGIDCSDLSVAYTPLNGAGLVCVQRVLGNMGMGAFHVVAEQAEPNGDFPTCPKPNPEVPQTMEAVIDLASRERCDLALATDPDADRVGVVVRHGGEYITLSGNQVGVLLLDWLARRAASREGLDRKVAVTTIVSTPMADDVANGYGLELRRTLTGFKFTGEQIGLLEQDGRRGDFLFGLEESLGYLSGTHVRDKDGIEACMLVCEMAADLKADGLDLVDAMARLYDRYGWWSGKQLTRAFEGVDGAERMAALMDRFRAGAPIEIANLTVDHVIDYKAGAPMPIVNSLPDEPVQTLPPSNVLEWRLSNGSRVLVRPSGTEPKLKVYLFAKGLTKESADNLLDALCSCMNALLDC